MVMLLTAWHVMTAISSQLDKQCGQKKKEVLWDLVDMLKHIHDQGVSHNVDGNDHSCLLF